jgi:DNA repair protein RadC
MIVARASDAAALFGPCFVDAEREVLAVGHLGEDRRLIEMVVIGGGGLDSIGLQLRRIFGDALRLGASGLIVAHNHPSGDPEPSRQDIEATRTLAATGASLGVRLHDHFIFAGGEMRSLRALGLL